MAFARREIIVWMTSNDAFNIFLLIPDGQGVFPLFMLQIIATIYFVVNEADPVTASIGLGYPLAK